MQKKEEEKTLLSLYIRIQGALRGITRSLRTVRRPSGV